MREIANVAAIPIPLGSNSIQNIATFPEDRMTTLSIRMRSVLLLMAIALAVSACDVNTSIARVAMRLGKFETAARYYRDYLTENPKDLRTLRRLALIECYELGEFDSCAVRADTVLWYMPTDTASVAAATYAHTMLAQQASEAGDTAAAQQRFDRMVEIHRHAGYWNYMNEYYERASRNYLQIIHLRPDSVSAYLRLGLIRWNRNDDDSALVWFKRAEEVDPLNEDALVNQIVVLRNLYRIDEALSVVDRLADARATLYPDSSFTFEPDTVTFPPMTLDFRGDTTHWRTTGFHEYGTGF